jgi:hypothetical protein
MNTENAIISTGGHVTLTGHQSVNLGTIKAGREIGIGSAEGPAKVVGPGASIESVGSSITMAVGGQILLNGNLKANANIDLISRSARPESVSVAEKTKLISTNDRITVTTNGGVQLAKAALEARSLVAVDAKANVELGETVSANQVQLKALETISFLGKLKAKAIDADATFIRFGKGSILSLGLDTDPEVRQPVLKTSKNGSSIEFLEGSEFVISSPAKNRSKNPGNRLVLAQTRGGKITLEKKALVGRPEGYENPVVEGGELVLRVKGQ